jgi:D-alanine-D-alanine ligase
MRVGITCDLKDEYLAQGFSEEDAAEFDSEMTVAAIAAALRRFGFRPERIGTVKALARRLAAGQRWDLVFNIAEGVSGFGRESQVPALLEAYDIPYTFSDPLVCALTLHKGMAKRVVRDAGVPTADFAVVEDLADLGAITLSYPLFAKPVAEGTSKGIGATSIVESGAALLTLCDHLLRRYRQPVLVETYLPGREFTVGILGGGRNAAAIGVMEVELAADAEAGLYSYENKKHDEWTRYRLVHDDAAREAERVALAAWRALGGRDGGRVDIRLNAAGGANFIEANVLPGINPERSDLVICARQAGIGYDELLGRILGHALERAGLRWPTRGRRTAIRAVS